VAEQLQARPATHLLDGVAEHTGERAETPLEPFAGTCCSPDRLGTLLCLLVVFPAPDAACHALSFGIELPKLIVIG
jgi:hypothetical protein